MAVRREPFVTTRQFLASARSIGIRTVEGCCEILDNAFDADATEVRIHVERGQDGELGITFIDNGSGIPAVHVDEDGESHQGIPYVLSYGGRIPHPNKTDPVGKFGWGLSQTATCLSRRTEVYTKTNDDASWRACWYDYDELADEPNFELPEETTRQPPWFELPDTGTIIAMRKVDLREFGSPQKLHGTLVADLGRMYRYFLQQGRTITVSFRDGKAHKETKVMISDPLMRMEGCRYRAKGAETNVYEPVYVETFDDDHPLGPIREADGSYAKMYTTFARLDSSSIRRALNLPLTGSGGTINRDVSREFGINQGNTGFSLVRNGREIAHGQTLGLFAKSGRDNYFRAEVMFSDALDDLFHIRTNKSRFGLDKALFGHIEEIWGAMVTKINVDQVDFQDSLKPLNSRADEVPNAERIAARAAPSLPRKRVDPLVQNQSTKAIRDEVAAKIEALQAEAKREQEAMLRRAKRAAEEGRKEDAKRAKDKARVIAEEFSERKERITTRFAFDAPCRKDEGLVGTGELFDVRSRGDEAWITINTATSFYKHVYNAAKQEADLVDLLDLLIMAMAYAEHMMDEDEASKAAWQNARREVSTLAETMVGTMAVTALGGLSAEPLGGEA